MSIRDLVGATFEFRTEAGGFDHEYILCIRPCEWQPILALHLLSAKNHAWAGTVPIDGGNLSIVSAREERSVLRVTRDGIERPASWIDHGSVDDVRATVGEFELNGWTLGVAGSVDRWWAQRSGREWHTMSVGICGSASGFLSGADGCNNHAREG